MQQINIKVLIEMQKLTTKEDKIMTLFWEKGKMFVKDLIGLYPEPKPHFNTISSIVRGLEAKGFLSYTAYGNTYQYYPAMTPEEYGKNKMSGLVNKYFENSYLDVVSTFLKDDKVQLEDLRKLVEEIEKSNPAKK